ncbi:hypothetical protein AMATHDRAFT_150901 [Amanita thiersii Skay4041]|uniref:CoA carboxyltransferase C-terminal domain-containing protein n=1 Tax=Amanita thiersii Skay4041 TaxID=703135 RepID=A0A2A9NI26_9AGAR|nr:hypothetical protein AMATHDRAFT_150901 [Amanita thiersii Skay4041]
MSDSYGDKQARGAQGKPKEVDDAKSWEYPLTQLQAQQNLVRTPDPNNPGYIRQKQGSKLWVRERLDALLDARSFVEIGSVAGRPIYDEATGELKSFTPANCVMGWGRVQSRKVFVTADDFSVRGGHADGGISWKAQYGEIRLLDGSSGGGSVATYLALGATYIPGLAGLGQSMDALAVVPVASALLGPVVGLAAAKAALSHFSVMVKGLSQLFAAGPPVVKQATFEDLSKEALGGWEIHALNGSVDNVATSEQGAFNQIKQFLSYLPSSIFQLPPMKLTSDSTNRREQELISIIPRRRSRPYDIRRLICLIVDQEDGESTYFEIGALWGRCIVTGLARLGGKPVGVIASDCMVNGGISFELPYLNDSRHSFSGAIDAFGSQKTARFCNMCNHFGLPLLNLVDQPGFAVGSVAERIATIRHGASALAALYNATVPIYTVILRRVFGVAGGAFSDYDDGPNLRVSWPSGDWGSLPLEGGIEAAYKRKLDTAKSNKEREEIMENLLEQFEDVRSPIKTANKFGIEEIIDPRDTRPLACEWAAHVYEHTLPQLLVVRQARFGYDAKPSSGKGYHL